MLYNDGRTRKTALVDDPNDRRNIGIVTPFGITQVQMKPWGIYADKITRSDVLCSAYGKYCILLGFIPRGDDKDPIIVVQGLSVDRKPTHQVYLGKAYLPELGRKLMNGDNSIWPEDRSGVFPLGVAYPADFLISEDIPENFWET